MKIEQSNAVIAWNGLSIALKRDQNMGGSVLSSVVVVVEINTFISLITPGVG